jgi:hypothetical protein
MCYCLEYSELFPDTRGRRAFCQFERGTKDLGLIFSFTSRTTDVSEKQVVCVDVTEELSLLVTRMSPTSLVLLRYEISRNLYLAGPFKLRTG